MNTTSAQSLAAVGQRTEKSDMDAIEKVIRNACRAGAKDISGREIQAVLRATRHEGHGMSESAMEAGGISARVSKLLAAGRVQRDPEKRKCTVTQRPINPLSMPMVQARLLP